MSERAYDRLANVFVLVAVVSALLFNMESPWHWLVGAIGACAGIAAVVLYFTNQVRPEEKPDDVSTSLVDSRVEKILHEAVLRGQQNPLTISETWMTKVSAQAGQYAALTYLTGNAKVSRIYLDRHAVRHGVYWSDYLRETQSQQCESELFSVSEIAECAVEIIKTLSAGSDHDRWEYTFGPHGLKVTEAKAAKDRSIIRDRAKMGEFDFGNMSETIQ